MLSDSSSASRKSYCFTTTGVPSGAALKKISNLLKSGYRVVLNSGPDAGESVPHLHAHVLGKRALAWLPG